MSPFGIGFNSPAISYYQLVMSKLGRYEEYTIDTVVGVASTYNRNLFFNEHCGCLAVLA